jgi:replicative DNA helicase
MMASSTGFTTFPTALARALENTAEAFSRDGGLAGVSTGLHDLDRMLGGLHSSDLLILASRPSMGKSSLGLNIAFDVARKYAWEPRPDGSKKTISGGVVAFFQLEMSADQLAMRLLSVTRSRPSAQSLPVKCIIMDHRTPINALRLPFPSITALCPRNEAKGHLLAIIK